MFANQSLTMRWLVISWLSFFTSSNPPIKCGGTKLQTCIPLPICSRYLHKQTDRIQLQAEILRSLMLLIWGGRPCHVTCNMYRKGILSYRVERLLIQCYSNECNFSSVSKWLSKFGQEISCSFGIRGDVDDAIVLKCHVQRLWTKLSPRKLLNLIVFPDLRYNTSFLLLYLSSTRRISESSVDRILCLPCTVCLNICFQVI